MKKLSYLTGLVVALAIVFAACQKTTFDDKTTNPESNLKIPEIPPPPPPPGDECETAFGYGADYATCFIDEGFGNWGWTNSTEVSPFTIDLYAAAGQCNTNVGTIVGTVTVEKFTNEVNVTYSLDPPYTLEEIHFYIGETMFPSFKGKPTVAPGKYTYKNDELGGAVSYSFTIYDLENNDIYFIAHAVVCGL